MGQAVLEGECARNGATNGKRGCIPLNPPGDRRCFDGTDLYVTGYTQPNFQIDLQLIVFAPVVGIADSKESRFSDLAGGFDARCSLAGRDVQIELLQVEAEDFVLLQIPKQQLGRQRVQVPEVQWQALAHDLQFLCHPVLGAVFGHR